jgi:hypothetical protein
MRVLLYHWPSDVVVPTPQDSSPRLHFVHWLPLRRAIVTKVEKVGQQPSPQRAPHVAPQVLVLEQPILQSSPAAHVAVGPLEHV